MILVTGAAGFIGSAVMKGLVDAGIPCIGIDSFRPTWSDFAYMKEDDYTKQRMKALEVAHLVHDYEIGSNYTETKSKPPTATLQSIMDDYKPHTVIHLAARAGVKESMYKTNDYIRNNNLGTDEIVKTCAGRTCVKRVLYASSSSVYGETDMRSDTGWLESQPLDIPLNPYAGTKLLNEVQFKSSDIQETIAMRFFTVYGPWHRQDMAIQSFIRKLVNNSNPSITIRNGGHLFRDFTYINDIVNWIVALTQLPDIDSAEGITRKQHETYNLSYGDMIPVEEMVRDLADELYAQKAIFYKKDIERIINYTDELTGESVMTYGNNDKIIEATGIKPQVDFELGLKATVAWFREQQLNGNIDKW